jgi:hypothetical protein
MSFVLFRPVIDGKRGRSHGAPVALISRLSGSLRESHRRQVVLGPLFFPVVYRKTGGIEWVGPRARSLIAAGRPAMLAAVQGDNGVQSAAGAKGRTL